MDAARKHFSQLIATFFYAGLSPKAPGTIGSLAALPFAWILWQLPVLWAWGIFAAILVIGIWASGEIVRQSGIQDNQKIVIDEVLGIFLTASIANHTYWHYFLVFILFRIFDIWKPGPVRWVDQNIEGGFGVIADDLVAALLAMLCLLPFHHPFFRFLDQIFT